MAQSIADSIEEVNKVHLLLQFWVKTGKICIRSHGYKHLKTKQGFNFLGSKAEIDNSGLDKLEIQFYKEGVAAVKNMGVFWMCVGLGKP